MEIIVTDANFEKEVLKSEIPVLVDFYSTWCGPCKIMANVVEEIAKEFDGVIKVVKANTEENLNATDTYRILSVPTLLFFKGGDVVEAVEGVAKKERIIAIIENLK